MTRSSFHFRTVSGSDDLQRVVAALKERPLTTWQGIQETRVAAFSAAVSEVNHNDGYAIGRVMHMDGKNQVHTYVLLQAPGWSPRWVITDDKKIALRSHAPAPAQPAPSSDRDDLTIREVRRCMNPACRKDLPFDPADPMRKVCDDACRAAWKASTFKNTDGGLF